MLFVGTNTAVTRLQLFSQICHEWRRHFVYDKHAALNSKSWDFMHILGIQCSTVSWRSLINLVLIYIWTLLSCTSFPFDLFFSVSQILWSSISIALNIHHSTFTDCYWNFVEFFFSSRLTRSNHYWKVEMLILPVSLLFKIWWTTATQIQFIWKVFSHHALLFI